MAVWDWWLWCYPIPSEGGWHGGIRKEFANSLTMPPRSGPEIKDEKSSAKDGQA